MSSEGFGSEQLWGLCPGASSGPVEPGDGGLALLLADTADLRYLFSNLPSVVVSLGLGAPGGVPAAGDAKPEEAVESPVRPRKESARVVLYERLSHILARQLVRLALLARVAAAPSLEEKIRVAHAYMEVHANLRLSDDSLEAFDSAALSVQALVSPALSKGLEGEVLGAFNLLRQAVDLRALLKGGDRDDVYAACGVYRAEVSRCRAAVAGAAAGDRTSSSVVDVSPVSAASAPRRTVRTSLSLVRREEAPPPTLEESFDIRLRDYYGERYDVRENLSLWDLDIRLDKMLPFVPGIFFSSFRASGLGYLRPYFRLPQTLGATEPSGPVSRRAQTSEESRMYCRHENPSFGSVDVRKKALAGYKGDIVTGPWLEAMSDLHLAVRGREDVEVLLRGIPSEVYSLVRQLASAGATQAAEASDAIEMYRTFQNAGPDSHEGIFTGVEIAVVNLIVCGSVFATLVQDGRLRLLPATGQAFSAAVGQRAALARVFQAAFVSLEAIRLIDPPRARSGQGVGPASMGAPSDGPEALKPCLAAGCRLLVELPDYVCQMDKEKVIAFAKHVEERAGAAGFKLAGRRCVAPPFAQYLPSGWREAHPTHVVLEYGGEGGEREGGAGEP